MIIFFHNEQILEGGIKEIQSFRIAWLYLLVHFVSSVCTNKITLKLQISLIAPSKSFAGSSICILLFCIANYSHVFIYSILKLNTNVEIYSLDSFEIENIVLHDILINTLKIRNLFDKTSQISQGYLVSKRFLIQKLSHQM